MAWSKRWLVLAVSIWMQCCSGVGYVFGSLSPVIKTSLDYNQTQINRLAVAKDIGGSVGLMAGLLCDLLPPWGLILVGLVHDLVGYGWLWLIVVKRVAQPHFALVCVLILLGTNGATYFNTASLVSSVRSFPYYRGPVVGILKGFNGLGGAIFSCIYIALYAPDQASFIFMVAVGPPLMAFLAMFIIRPMPEDGEGKAAQDKKFNVLYCICLVIPAYLLATIIVQDSSETIDRTNKSRLFAAGLLALLALPFAVVRHWSLAASTDEDEVSQLRAPLLEDAEIECAPGIEDGQSAGSIGNAKATSGLKEDAMVFSELEDESSRLFPAALEGAILKRRGPRRGEEFTMREALVKADLWLLFLGLACGAGSGLTLFDNLGQVSESLGYKDAHIFVALISIWNFLGRFGGGYVSELIVREYALPRPILLAALQAEMAIGLVWLAVAMPGALYVGSFLVGVGYGGHWSIVPATASELFGLKNFGMMYNFLCMANPVGSFILSGFIAGALYDREAEKQHGGISPPDVDALKCEGTVCFRLTFFIMAGVCIFGAALNSIVVSRTRRVYTMLYGKQRDEREANSTQNESGC